MAAVVLDKFSAPQQESLYTDLLLDLKINYTQNTELKKRREIRDIQTSRDIGAIKNSLFTLFTTMPGQKILNPTYGLNLMQYLFTSVSTSQAQIIGEAIFTGISKFEPRVRVRNINVDTNFDENQYSITMTIDVPSLDIFGVSLVGTLTESGYYFN